MASPYRQIAPIQLGGYQVRNFAGAWHLVYYIPSRNHSEPFSRSLIQFKEGDSRTVDSYTAIATRAFPQTGIVPDYIIRCLGSSELRATGKKSLDKLGRSLAECVGAAYVPTAVLKRRATAPMHTLKTKDARECELEGVYYLNPEYEFEENASFLILDDISTTNTTTNAVRAAIQAELPLAQVYIFTLGKTEYGIDVNDTFDPAAIR